MNSMAEKLAERNRAKEQARQAGGAAAIEKQHREGKLTARERVEKLLDPGSFQELDLMLTSAEDVLDTRTGGIPTDGVVTGYGEVNGRPLFVWSQDATVLGGSLGVVHAQKITTLMEKALQARVPVVGMIDSVGERAGDLLQYPHFYSLESIAKIQTLSSGSDPPDKPDHGSLYRRAGRLCPARRFRFSGAQDKLPARGATARGPKRRGGGRGLDARQKDRLL